MPFTKGHKKYLIKHTEESKIKMQGFRVPHFKKECIICKKEFFVSSALINKKLCSKSCSNILAKSRKPFLGKHHLKESKEKMTEKLKGKIPWNKELKGFLAGEKNWHYKKDRSLLVKRQERNDSSYYDWRLQVYKRDSYKCKINNVDCAGRIIAHHILGWAEYPELRYDINNGITLCLAHHPRKRAEEKRLAPYFMELMSVSKV